MPSRLSSPPIDFTTGQNAFAGILAALIQRGVVGQGTYLEVCLSDSAVALQAWGLQRHWEQRFVEAGVPFAPVNNLAELGVHPQTQASRIIQEYTSTKFGTLKTVARAVRFAGEVGAVGSPPPGLGQHTRDVLREIGYVDAQIDAYQAAGAIGGA